MKIYKFGGGVIVNADTIKRLGEIVKRNNGSEKLVIVLSALAKNTNKLEEVTENHYHNRNLNLSLKGFLDFHRNIANGLGITDEVEKKLNEIKVSIIEKATDDFNKLYDQIVPYGEIISSFMISLYLRKIGCDNQWLDAREIVITNRNYRNARVDFELTGNNLKNAVLKSDHQVFIIQGFIGSDPDGNSTTLGREGSDYTASIVSNLLNADKLIIWKDVKGVYNADPKVYQDALLIDEMSYNDAILLTSFGAKVLHHKSISPLQEKGISLKVKYFFNPDLSGTEIHQTDDKLDKLPIVVNLRKQKLVYSGRQNLDFIDGLAKNYRLDINLKIKDDSYYYCIGGNHELINEFLSEILEFDGLHILDVALLKIRNPEPIVIGALKEKYAVEFEFVKDEILYLIVS